MLGRRPQGVRDCWGRQGGQALKRSHLHDRDWLPAVLLFLVGQAGRALPAAAVPQSPVDQSQVPHYFGPYPNWANSQFTLPDVGVAISGDGSGATATATVGANGAVTAVTLTSPGSGYTAATVSLTGAGSGATADATAVTAN